MRLVAGPAKSTVTNTKSRGFARSKDEVGAKGFRRPICFRVLLLLSTLTRIDDERRRREGERWEGGGGRRI